MFVLLAGNGNLQYIQEYLHNVPSKVDHYVGGWPTYPNLKNHGVSNSWDDEFYPIFQESHIKNAWLQTTSNAFSDIKMNKHIVIVWMSRKVTKKPIFEPVQKRENRETPRSDLETALLFIDYPLENSQIIIYGKIHHHVSWKKSRFPFYGHFLLIANCLTANQAGYNFQDSNVWFQRGQMHIVFCREIFLMS